MTFPAGWVSPACAIPKPIIPTTTNIVADTIPTLDVFIFLTPFQRFGYPHLNLGNKVSYL
jgi:hypothetical protein